MSRNLEPLKLRSIDEIMDHLAMMLLTAPKFANADFPDLNADMVFSELDDGLQSVSDLIGDENRSLLMDLSRRARSHTEADPADETGEARAGCKLILEMWEFLKNYPADSR